MKKSEINLTIELDDQNVPENIKWKATEPAGMELQNADSIALSIWDSNQKNTLRIDLWTKNMPVDEMKRFCIDSLGGFAQTILNSTGDEFMSSEINALCDKFVEHIKKDNS